MTTIRTLSGAEARAAIPALSAILIGCVEGGAGVSFMAPLPRAKAEAFWTGVADGVAAGDRVLLVAERDGAVVGTVQVVFAPQDNQPHRADVAKMLVAVSARRQGVGAALMRAVDNAARDAGRTLLVLDTVTGSVAERMYAGLGWVRVGVIPGFALMPDGAMSGTTLFYRQL